MSKISLEEWRSWTCDHVCEWLETLQLGFLKEIFQANQISGDILEELTNDILRLDLGISAFGHRIKILNGFKELKASQQPTHMTANTQLEQTFSTLSPPPPPQVVDPHSHIIDLLVLHAAPLLIRDSKDRVFPMEKLDLEKERRAIVNSLLNEIRHKSIHVRFDVATADTLRKLMTAWKCRVLHFSGHGMGQNAALCFEDINGCTHLISPNELRQLIFSASSTEQALQLVFVNSCHSEKVASVFIDAGIPHVIAVHSDSLIVDGSATMFAKHFYLSLFCGDTVKTAFEIAKMAVSTLPFQSKASCCCAHVHEKHCPWVQAGSHHAMHHKDACCCKGNSLKFPHDESSKFLLLGNAADHDVALFKDLPNGKLQDFTPKCKSFLPSIHGQFIGRHVETYLIMRSLTQNSVTVCLGAPGIGKSSLVISAAHFAFSRHLFPDGVFYVDLEGLQLSDVRYAIARSIGIPAGESDDEVFAEFGQKRCLLVLDKVEELLDQDEEKTREYLGKIVSIAPFTRLLLASRRSLQIPNVTAYSLSLPELPLHTATDLLRLAAPRCSRDAAARLAKICGCLPLAIRVVGRALANARSTLTPEVMIRALERSEQRLEGIKELNQAGQKECVDRCIRSSFSQLEEPLRLAFMAFGFFRGNFDLPAANAILEQCNGDSFHSVELSKSGSSSSSWSSKPSSSNTRSSTLTSLPDFAFSKRNNVRVVKDDTISIRSLGEQLLNMDDFGFDFDDAMTNDGYHLLDVESTEEIKAREVVVAPAKVALDQLTQWSLVEFDVRINRYRMHNLLQLFAEKETNEMEKQSEIIKNSISLGKELALSWKRRFVRYYCIIVAEASHSYRFEGNLLLFDQERPNIESAMRLANDLCSQSLERMRDLRQKESTLQYDVDAEEADVQSLGPQNSSDELRLHRARCRTSSICSTSSTLTSTTVTSTNNLIVDALLYGNLVARGRFLFRSRLDGRRRIGLFTTCLQLLREIRTLTCTCGNCENDPTILLCDLDEVKHERDLSFLETLPTYEEPHPISTKSCCVCVGIRELVALEALLLTELGFASSDVTEWKTAEYYYLESLRLQQEVLGRSDHAQVAEVLNLLGVCLSNRSGISAFNIYLIQLSEKLLNAAFYMRKRVLGKQHPEFATSLNNVANFYRTITFLHTKPLLDPSKLHQIIQSQSLKRSEEIVSDALSARSRTTGSTSSSPSMKKANEFKQVDIEQLYRESLRIRQETLGPTHPMVAQSLNNLARHLSTVFNDNRPHTLSEQEKNEIFHLYERALLIRRKTFGNSSSETSATLNNMGNFMRHTGNFKAAENFFLEALKIHQTYLKHTENDHQARTLINLGRLYRAQKKYEEAIHFFEKAKEIRQKLFPGSKEVGFCLEMIGKCMILDGKHIKKGKILEEKGKKLLKFGLCAEEASTSINSVHHFSLPNSFSSFIWQISIFDFFELKALKSRQFVLPSKIIGEKGIHLKKIEAITHAQLRYIGPWPFEVSNIDNKQDLKNIKVYLNIAATSEKSIEKAKQLAIEHLRKIQIQWENFQASSSYNQRRRDHSNPPSTGSQGTNGHKSSSSSSFSSRLKARNRSVSYRKCHKKIQ